MSHPDSDELRDREEIRSLLASYFVALDNGQMDEALRLFGDDARLAMNGVHVADGRAAIVDWFTSGTGTSAVGTQLTDIRMMHHMMGTHLVDLRGDAASSTTYAVAHLALNRDGRIELVVRGLRYLDEWRRTSDGWRVTDRIHTLDWSHVAPGAEAVTRDERVTR